MARSYAHQHEGQQDETCEPEPRLDQLRHREFDADAHKLEEDHVPHPVHFSESINL